MIQGKILCLRLLQSTQGEGSRPGKLNDIMDEFLLPPAGRSQETVSPSLDHDFESFLGFPNKDLNVQGRSLDVTIFSSLRFPTYL